MHTDYFICKTLRTGSIFNTFVIGVPSFGFFLKRGFDENSATGVATVLLQQAKIDEVNVYTLLDTLKGLDDVQISGLVGEIVNYNRSKVSVIGFKTENTVARQESRNIVV